MRGIRQDISHSPFHNDLTTFHHESDVLENCDVSNGVTVDGDDVGEVAGLDCTHAVRPTEQVCCVDRSRLDRLHRRQSELYHHPEFARVQAVWVNRRVSAERYFDTG